LVQLYFPGTPRAHRACRHPADAASGKVDKDQPRLTHRYEQMRRAPPCLDKAKCTRCPLLSELNRATASIRIERTERDNDTRCALVHGLAHFPCEVRGHLREHEVRKGRRPHRSRTGGATEFLHDNQNLAKTALFRVGAEDRNSLLNQLVPYC